MNFFFRKKFILLFVLFLVVCFCIFLFYRSDFCVGGKSSSKEEFDIDQPLNTCREDLSFVNRDVVCGSPDVIRKTGYAEAKKSIEDFVSAEKEAGRISEMALYFRDLERGPVFGINELAEFAPASLLKLPLAIVYFASAEVQPELLDTKLTFLGESSGNLHITKPRESAEAGRPYSIRDLLRMMLVFSDNVSYDSLEGFLLEDDRRVGVRQEIFQELGMIDPKDRVESTITVRGYASIFRILYNISFLNEEYSNQILQWLSESEYLNGIVAGVPRDIAVSHKFGERVYDTGVKQLHDCGIVYYPDNPYVLCVMTRGADWKNLETMISSISKMVYQEVDSRKIRNRGVLPNMNIE